MAKNIEVLIVEDDVRIAQIHEKFLEQLEGFQTIGMSHTIEEAKIWLDTLKPDLILLDIYFPDKLGTELIDYIKQTNIETDIILITAAAEVDIVKKAYASGVIDFLLKPLTMQRFRECLQKYKEKKDILNSSDRLKANEIHRLWNNMTFTEESREHSPKGIDPVTKNGVINFLNTCGGGVTAEKLGRELGISRTTARRYLEYLMVEKIIYVEHIYGTVGRPERRYFIK
ncbi:two-component system response regulator [Solibacillus sp. R5-41]|uniref:response regulator n=1 Tax=Solibacillus sp. R5-41 TaxID=2048654 RepID=UPI000C126E3C|nr:response regulator [Solibacillus sp. R5-41]ATP41320.1 two-component system response regulator [Solibacillus sp. R5-41]